MGGKLGYLYTNSCQPLVIDWLFMGGGGGEALGSLGRWVPVARESRSQAKRCRCQQPEAGRLCRDAGRASGSDWGTKGRCHTVGSQSFQMQLLCTQKEQLTWMGARKTDFISSSAPTGWRLWGSGVIPPIGTLFSSSGKWVNSTYLSG